MHKRRNDPARRAPMTIEPLEQRTLLSAVVPSGAVAAALATTANPGNSPAAIRTAYGFDQIRFSNNKTAGDGAGQTIAIVNPYDDPSIAADLATFDVQFSIPDPPQLTKVDELGGQNLPVASARWAGETALDVEWAHAIAPKADIVLVEANSPNVNDLIQAVDTARHLPGVSVVSMSWGAPEFASERLLDALFTTPSDHSGVTFVAAAGDLSSGDPTQWPAISANVLSVGGTSLSSNSTSGAYVSESVWAGSAGGTSAYEPEGTAQLPAQQTGARTTPDVTYNADPGSGYAVYNSVPYQGRSGWQVVGGTSAGAPQWAALIAIADQGRQLNGMAPLDGSTGTLPLLYQLGSINFNPVGVTSGVTGTSTSGSGLGSPRAAELTTALSDAVPPSAPQLSSATGPAPSVTGAPPTDSTSKKDKNAQAVTPAALPYVRPPTAAAWPPPPAFGPSPTMAYVRSAVHMSEVVSVQRGGDQASSQNPSRTRPAAMFIAASPAANVASQAMTFVQNADGAFHWVAGIGESVCQWASAPSVAGEHLASVAEGAALPASFELPVVYHFATVDIPRTFGDALGAFIHNSAQLSAGGGRLSPTHARAWAITLAVLGADAVVLRFALVRRDRKKKSLVLASRIAPAAPARLRVRAIRAAV